MTRAAAIVLGLSAAMCSAYARCEEPALPEHETVFYLAEDRLITLRVRVLLDGENFHAAWRRHVKSLFAEFDRDVDGELHPEELDAARRFGQGTNYPRIVLPTRSGSAPKTDTATIDVLADVFRRLEAGPLVWQPANRVRRMRAPGFALSDEGGGDAFFIKVDTDGDGKVSRSELLAAPAALAKLDQNDDEAIGATELPSLLSGSSPFDPGRVRANPMSQLVIASTAILDDGWAIRVLRRYNRGADAGKIRDNHLTAVELGLPVAEIQPFDADNDGRLDLEELKRFLVDPPLTAEIVIRLGERSGFQPAVEIAGAADVRIAQSTDARVVLAGGTSVLEIRVDPPPPSADQIVSRLFRIVDADANQYLDETESERFPLYSAQFDLIDRDADGKIYERELLAFGEKQAAFARVCIVATTEDRGRRLFQMLDADGDGRLDRREFQSAAQVVDSWDANGDDCLEERELPNRVVLTFGQARPMRQSFVTAFDPGADFTARPVPTIVPAWFQRMDRNRDGEVSRREFLGSAERFGELDADGNAVLDPLEAANLQ